MFLKHLWGCSLMSFSKKTPVSLELSEANNCIKLNHPATTSLPVAQAGSA